jgi:hypothetical protein
VSEEGATSEAGEEENFYLARWSFNYTKLMQLTTAMDPEALSDKERKAISEFLLQNLLAKTKQEDISVYRMEQLNPNELGHAAAVMGMCLAFPNTTKPKHLEQNPK